MPTYTVRSRATSPVATQNVNALSRDAAVSAAIAGATGGGATGAETHIYSCIQTAASGPTGTFTATYNVTAGPTGSTFSAVSREDAINQAVAAGPTGPRAGLAIEQTF